MSDLFYRSVERSNAKVDEDKRTATVSFSSEYPVSRSYYGQEILLHGEKNVDLSYINDVGSVLARHGGGLRDIVGGIERAWIDDRRGEAIITFDDDELGNLALRKMQSNSLRGISFGYRIEKGRRLEDENDVWTDPDTKIEYRGPAIIGTYWRAHEITLTPVPADHTVGFNRSLLDNIYFEELTRNVTEDSRMDQKDKQEVMEMIRSALKEIKVGVSADEVRGIFTEIQEERAKPKIVVTRDELNDLESRAGAVSDTCKAEVLSMATSGRSHVEMLTFISDESMKNNEPDARHTDSNNPGDDKTDDKGYRSIDEIPDDLFVSAFKG